MARRHTDLLRAFGLAKNPYTDRTAERTGPLDEVSLFVPSDLAGFEPSETTYLFFGKRGSGKTTIRMMMQRANMEQNAAARASGLSRGHFVVDFSKPGFLTARLRVFQESIGASLDNWDATFSDAWTNADVVDCILSSSLTCLVEELADCNSVEGQDMIRRLQADPKAARQLLIMAYLYADTDARSLASVRSQLLGSSWSKSSVAGAAAAGAGLVAGTVLVTNSPAAASLVSAPFEKAWNEVSRAVPAVGDHPALTLGVLAAGGATGAWFYRTHKLRKSLARAAAVQAPVRVVRQQAVGAMANLLDTLFSASDDAETVRTLCVGISAHQKLDRLASLLHLLGFESLACFGDCFDEVSLLDPVLYPAAMKAFAKEVCRNDLLNFGRMHFFFPDSRISLDLNTDKTLKEARFDRHFVRDLNWSRHQLHELAERRFLSAQLEAQRRAAAAVGSPTKADGHLHTRESLAAERSSAAAASAVLSNGVRISSFNDLFKSVKAEDFSSALAKLSTPRELMIMMTELMGRIEANPDASVSAQDLEICVNQALTQAV